MQDHAKHGLIKQFALHWPRNIENLEEIEDVVRKCCAAALGSWPKWTARVT